MADDKVVLVTGGSGYIGSYVLIELLKNGYIVRTTVRNLGTESLVRKSLERGGVSPELGKSVTFFQTDLLSDDGWKEAINGATNVIHVASPIPPYVPSDENELIRPACEGTLRVLRFAKDSGSVKRVVLTSSMLAVFRGPLPEGRDYYDERDWSDISLPGLQPYPKSKIIAEKAAWDFIKKEGGKLELTVINPSLVWGPPLSTDYSSTLGMIKSILEGNPQPLRSQNLCDVRDVALLHVRALSTPQAVGQRIGVGVDRCVFHSEVAEYLKKHLSDRDEVHQAIKKRIAVTPLDTVTTSARMKISFAKAREMFQWEPISWEKTVMDTTERLIELGEVKG